MCKGLVFTYEPMAQMCGFDVRRSELAGLIVGEVDRAASFFRITLKHRFKDCSPFSAIICLAISEKLFYRGFVYNPARWQPRLPHPGFHSAVPCAGCVLRMSIRCSRPRCC